MKTPTRCRHFLIVGFAPDFPALWDRRSDWPRTTPPRIEFFEKKVRPVLVDNCYTCHSADTNAKGGLRVDDRNGLLQGGNSGPAVVPGKPEKSLLIQAVRHDRRSHENAAEEAALDREQIADLSHWIKDGAAWPQGDGSGLRQQAQRPNTTGCGRSTGPGSRCARPKPPQVSDAAWARERHRPLHPGPAGGEGPEAGRRRGPG